MEISYWQSRWQKDNTGWHMDQVYPPLPKLWSRASFAPNASVLVPLCGKSRDLHWLAEKTKYIVGVDVSSKALWQVMKNHPEPFTQDSSHGLTVFRSEHMELWEGDFLKFPNSKIPAPDIIYDKAAMVALPPDMRSSYAQKILECCGEDTQILLQTFEYDQDEMSGPPFSVDEHEIRNHYGHRFSITLMHEQSKFDELSKFQRRGLSSHLNEKVFLLRPS